MSETILSGLLFLINTVFNLYLFILIIRLILVFVKSDYFNPLTQFIVKLTHWLIQPVKRILPNIKQIETATLCMVFLLEMIKFFLTTWISYDMPHLIGLPVLAIGDICALIIQAFTYGIILQVILSFIQPFSPLLQVMIRFNSPIMRPIQRIIPPIGNIDISPIPALILLQLLGIVLAGPLLNVGQTMASS